MEMAEDRDFRAVECRFSRSLSRHRVPEESGQGRSDSAQLQRMLPLSLGVAQRGYSSRRGMSGGGHRPIHPAEPGADVRTRIYSVISPKGSGVIDPVGAGGTKAQGGRPPPIERSRRRKGCGSDGIDSILLEAAGGAHPRPPRAMIATTGEGDRTGRYDESQPRSRRVPGKQRRAKKFLRNIAGNWLRRFLVLDPVGKGTGKLGPNGGPPRVDSCPEKRQTSRGFFEESAVWPQLGQDTNINPMLTMA